jgi:hypothetical protein
LQLLQVDTLTGTLRRIHAPVSFGLAACEATHARLRSLASQANTAARAVVLQGEVGPTVLDYARRANASLVLIERTHHLVCCELQAALRAGRIPAVCSDPDTLTGDVSLAAALVIAELESSQPAMVDGWKHRDFAAAESTIQE